MITQHGILPHWLTLAILQETRARFTIIIIPRRERADKWEYFF